MSLEDAIAVMKDNPAESVNGKRTQDRDLFILETMSSII